MKATERTMAQVLISPDQYIIPVFQRFYSWTEKEWRTLWDDLHEVLEARRRIVPGLHFVPRSATIVSPGVSSSSAFLDLDKQVTEDEPAKFPR